MDCIMAGAGSRRSIISSVEIFWENQGGKKGRKPLNITFCVWCQLLTEFGKLRTGSLVGKVEKSQLPSRQPHSATHAKYIFLSSRRTFLSGRGKDFRGQFGSKLCGIFSSRSLWPPWPLTSAPRTLNTRASPVPTKWGTRHICREKASSFYSNLKYLHGFLTKSTRRRPIFVGVKSWHKYQVPSIIGGF